MISAFVKFMDQISYHNIYATGSWWLDTLQNRRSPLYIYMMLRPFRRVFEDKYTFLNVSSLLIGYAIQKSIFARGGIFQSLSLRLFIIMSLSIKFPQSRWPFVTGGLGLLWILLLTATQNRQYIPSIPTRFSYVESLREKSTISAAQNRTMGFGAVLMAMLPE